MVLANGKKIRAKHVYEKHYLDHDIMVDTYLTDNMCLRPMLSSAILEAMLRDYGSMEFMLIIKMELQKGQSKQYQTWLEQ